ncbi:MAG TPA: diguanylate cyclase [Steroidobacteraceae bacterium]|nr:diguanylate cyclase [Steroidobacteraceae bacterium]
MSTFIASVRFNGWTVGARLLVINGLLAVALVFGGIIAWRALSAQSVAMSSLALISKGARYHQDAETQLADLRAAINAALGGQAHSESERKDLLTSMDDNSKDLHRDLLTLAKLDLPPDLIDTETRVQTLADGYLSNAGEIGRLAARNPTLAAALLPQFDVSASALNDAMEAQTEAFTSHIVQASSDAATAERDAKRWLVLAGVLINIIVGILVMLLSRSIRRSLKSVRDVAQALARGDLQARNLKPGTDELGELGRAINGMADSLNDVIGRLRADADRDAFGNQLGEGLEMADTEEEAYETLGRAMVTISPDLPTELLLADSSRAHLERATSHPLAGPAGCNVESPFSCMAVRRGTPVTFEDGEAVNSCTRLRGRPCGPVAAVCVPINFMGRSLGVLHAAAPIGRLPDSKQIARLTTLGAQAGARIGTVRAFHSTQQKAATDSLTGLHNRRSAEERARDLVATGRPFAVVLADLDHFKKLNDSRGHEAGDKALRLFSETLRLSMRDGDMASRWGGEEFVLLMPNANSHQANEAVDRIRASLATALLTGGTAAFTSSFGIADSTMSPRFERMVRIADEALYRAKEEGRDRAVIGDSRLASTGEFRRAVEHPASVSVRKLAEG